MAPSILKADSNLDSLKAGDYIVKLKDRAYLLEVHAAQDENGVGFSIQNATDIDNGEVMFRVRSPKGAWTEWMARLSERQLDDALSHINRMMSAEGKVVDPATPTVDGLMSAADKAKLDGIADKADVSKSWANDIVGSALALQNYCNKQFSPKSHHHDDEYVIPDELKALLRKEDFTAANIMELIVGVLKDVDVMSFKGADALMKKDEFTADAVKGKVGDVDAKTLEGKPADHFAKREHKHDEFVKRARDAKLISPNIGVVKKGVFVPNPDKGQLQHYVNGGDHKFLPPSAVGEHEFHVIIDNAHDAGVVTFEGFSEPVSPLPSTPGAKFAVHVLKVGDHTSAEVKVLRPGEA